MSGDTPRKVGTVIAFTYLALWLVPMALAALYWFAG